MQVITSIMLKDQNNSLNKSNIAVDIYDYSPEKEQKSNISEFSQKLKYSIEEDIGRKLKP